MSQSLLLQIARESITEVFEAKNSINKKELIERYPALNQSVASFITIYLGDELRGSMGSIIPQKTLLEDIIYNAKAAAFEDRRFPPLKISEYLQSTLELSLLTPPQEVVYTDIDDLRQKITQGKDGLILSLGDKQASFLPQAWRQIHDFDEFLTHLLHEAGLSLEDMKRHPQLFNFQVERERDEPILQ